MCSTSSNATHTRDKTSSPTNIKTKLKTIGTLAQTRINQTKSSQRLHSQAKAGKLVFTSQTVEGNYSPRYIIRMKLQ